MNLPSPVEALSSALLTEKNIQLLIKRDDLIHSELTGNKWRKLKYNLIQARQDNYQTLLTFGGAYSNHIHAVAAAGKLLNFKTIGVIRGERPKKLSPTLEYALSQGMQLYFISRETYRNKTDPAFLQELYTKLGKFYYIPEGGSNELALKGVGELIDELIDQKIDSQYICCASGTGGTIAGLAASSSESSISHNTLIGFPVLKNASWMYDEISELLKNREVNNYSLMLEYHFGGYAKYNQELIDFIKLFRKNHEIQLEPIYTGKMLFGIFDLIKKGYFPEGSTIVAVHTGGLQGLSGIKELNKISTVD